jgi:hypothetical protein
MRRTSTHTIGAHISFLGGFLYDRTAAPRSTLSAHVGLISRIVLLLPKVLQLSGKPPPRVGNDVIFIPQLPQHCRRRATCSCESRETRLVSIPLRPFTNNCKFSVERRHLPLPWNAADRIRSMRAQYRRRHCCCCCCCCRRVVVQLLIEWQSAEMALCHSVLTREAHQGPGAAAASASSAKSSGNRRNVLMFIAWHFIGRFIGSVAMQPQ